MSTDPLAVKTVPADERWDDTLDALALAVTRDMAERGLLHDDAHEAARYHIRGFARRLVNPLLDQVRAEVQAGHREALRLREANARLQSRLEERRRTRTRGFALVGFLAALWVALVLLVGSVLHGAIAGEPAPGTPVVAAAPASPAPAAALPLRR